MKPTRVGRFHQKHTLILGALLFFKSICCTAIVENDKITYMFSSIKHTIALGLLCVLAWSCSGLNLGMLGHAFMQTNEMSVGQHSMATTHECCNTETQDTTQTGAATMNHHTPVTVTVSDLFLILLAVALVAVLPPQKTNNVQLKWQLYARVWADRWSYLALFFNQLFSRGILHPKTW